MHYADDFKYNGLRSVQIFFEVMMGEKKAL